MAIPRRRLVWTLVAAASCTHLAPADLKTRPQTRRFTAARNYWMNVPSATELSSIAASVVLWAGVISGALIIIDWLIGEAGRKRIKDWAETAWLWLSYQRAGAFLEVMRGKRFQQVIRWIA